MAPGLLHSALVEECRQLVPPPDGLVLSWSGAALALLAAFAVGGCCGAACLGAAGAVAARWWFRPSGAAAPTNAPEGRLEGYLRRRLS